MDNDPDNVGWTWNFALFHEKNSRFSGQIRTGSRSKYGRWHFLFVNCDGFSCLTTSQSNIWISWNIERIWIVNHVGENSENRREILNLYAHVWYRKFRRFLILDVSNYSSAKDRIIIHRETFTGHSTLKRREKSAEKNKQDGP